MKKAIIMGSTALLMPLMTGPVVAEESLANMQRAPDAVSFDAFASKEAHSLKVGCDGSEVQEFLFLAGETPVFDAGLALADGNCNYEIRIVPRVEGAGGPEQVQFGEFQVEGGLIVTEPDKMALEDAGATGAEHVHPHN